MTARAQQHRRTHPPSWWARAFVVLGLLAGVLAMHGLGPGGMSGGTTDGAHHGRHQAQPMSTNAGTATQVEYVCHGTGPNGGHAHHADATCASGAVPAGHALPALTPDPTTAPAPDDGAGRSLPRSPEGARAPPSLAELQLLRI
ncbi:DUF6153 family protein [Streptomyces sp. NPDC020898]|uniref:DUF6153 family protein n=1 Tax=Streptomyces sp. NPDC020898 TaxID=3365101 RepID=UPI0037B33CDF